MKDSRETPAASPSQSQTPSQLYPSIPNSAPGVEYPSAPYATRPPKIYQRAAFCCLHVPLQKACTIIAIIGISLGCIFLAIGGGLLIMKLTFDKMIMEKMNHDKEKANEFSDALEYSSLILLVRGFYYIMFYIVLAFGAVKRNRKICKMWMIINIILILLTIIASVTVASVFGYPQFSISPMAVILLDLYFIYVVFDFVEELKVIGVVGGNEVVLNEDIFDADIFNFGIYGDGTAPGQRVNPPKYYPKIVGNPDTMSQPSVQEVTSSVGSEQKANVVGSGATSSSTLG